MALPFHEAKAKVVACLQACFPGEGELDVEAAAESVTALLGGDEYADEKGLLDHCLSAVVDSALDDEGQTTSLNQALELTFVFASRGLVDLSCPLNVINDVLGSQTIEECSVTFAYLESKKGFLLEHGFFAEHKKRAGAAKVALLRLCNSMVKRLSKANDTVFCGRIQMFLATVLSISDRSGVNLMGRFNVDNITEFTDEPDQTSLPEVDDGREKTSAPIDYNFYKKFWGLQEFFTSRDLVLQDPKKWSQLTEGVQLVFGAFASQEIIEHAETAEEDKKKKEKSSKKDKRKGSSSPRNRGDIEPPTPRASETGAAAIAATTSGDEFFAKFLTSTRLMSLQLRDPHFRRHILLQFLIYFKHLLTPPLAGKAALKPLNAKQKIAVQGFVKRAEQL